jgi:hypothetical protein
MSALVPAATGTGGVNGVALSGLTFAAFRISLAATRRDREALGLPRDAGDPDQAGPR